MYWWKPTATGKVTQNRMKPALTADYKRRTFAEVKLLSAAERSGAAAGAQFTRTHTRSNLFRKRRMSSSRTVFAMP
jgi:hypothetical protein